MSFKSWFENKSKEKSRSNITELLEQMVPICNQAHSSLVRSGSATSSEMAAVNDLQQRLMIELCGPIPIDEVKRTLVDPVLNRPDVSSSTKIAIESCLKYVGDRIKDT